MPLFSVVIPCFNAERYVRAALDSVFAQTFTDFELIVVDDGSADGTVAAVRECGGSVRLLQQTNQGAGAARNLGIEEASGEYLAFLDADDLWFPWSLQVMKEAIDANNAALVFGEVVEFSGGEPQPPASAGGFLCTRYAHPLDAYLGCGYRRYLSPAMALRREVALGVGGYPPGRINGEDTDLVLKLGTTGPCAIIHCPVVAAYRRHDANSTLFPLRAYNGALFQLKQERAGRYPGGGRLRLARWNLLTAHTRAISILCARPGHWRQGWHVYFATCGYNFTLMRWKYLTVFPLLACYWTVKGIATRRLSVRVAANRL